jgi:hypothetical protein
MSSNLQPTAAASMRTIGPANSSHELKCHAEDMSRRHRRSMTVRCCGHDGSNADGGRRTGQVMAKERIWLFQPLNVAVDVDW